MRALFVVTCARVASRGARLVRFVINGYFLFKLNCMKAAVSLAVLTRPNSALAGVAISQLFVNAAVPVTGSICPGWFMFLCVRIVAWNALPAS